ncbi:MAG: transposase [Thermodesulfovibrionales bacterium]|nr:transposase [Thermodesulfovibrionales bacterium]
MINQLRLQYSVPFLCHVLNIAASGYYAWLNRKPSVKKELWGGEFWTDGYYVVTVGERADWTTVEKYVQKQGRAREELRQLGFEVQEGHQNPMHSQW